MLSLLAIFFSASAYSAGLNETWTYRGSVTFSENESPEEELLVFKFMPDGGFKLDGRHADEWISYGEGRYHYQPETGEVFVTVEHGSFEWPYKGQNDYETLYWAQILESYPLYFKITERGTDFVKMREYANFYTSEANRSPEGLYQTTPVWQAEDGKYHLLAPETMKMRERTYQVDSGK